MSLAPEDEERVDSALRDALRDVPELAPSVSDNTKRRARAALRKPGEAALSLRDLAGFSDSVAVTAIILLAALFYAVVESLQLAKVFAGQRPS